MDTLLSWSEPGNSQFDELQARWTRYFEYLGLEFLPAGKPTRTAAIAERPNLIVVVRPFSNWIPEAEMRQNQSARRNLGRVRRGGPDSQRPAASRAVPPCNREPRIRKVRVGSNNWDEIRAAVEYSTDTNFQEIALK